MSNKNNRTSPAASLTLRNGKATGKVITRKPRKTPLGAAIYAAETAVATAEFRKQHALKRVDSFEAKIATIRKAASSHDALIATLRKNLDALYQMDLQLTAMNLPAAS